MMNDIIKIIIGFFYIFCFKVYCEINYITHPINIIIDPANLDLNYSLNKTLFHYLNKSAKILSNIINSIDNKHNKLTPRFIRSKCKKDIAISDLKTNSPDLIIFPIFLKFEGNNKFGCFQTKICEDNPSEKISPNIALFQINKNIKIKALINSPQKKYKFKLKLIKHLLDCLGLNSKFRIKTNQAQDNFFEIPTYLIEKSFAYNSIKKLYKLSNITFPNHNFDDLGNFYEQFWPYDSIIKDFRNEEIDIREDMTETSFNLLNDLNYYSLSLCDMIFDNKGKCHRIDQKCLTKKEFDNNYYLKYGIQKSKIICYFSNRNNILNNQCGNKFGVLLNDIIDYCPLVIKAPKTLDDLGDYEIPESLYFDKQEFKFLIPSEKCHPNMPRTIYFNKNYETNLLNLNDVVLTEENRKYFVSYLINKNRIDDYDYPIFLKFNGLIRSYRYFGNQNLIIDNYPESILKDRGVNHKISKYQKIFNFIGNNVYTSKDLLYKNYIKQKHIFKNEYNFMPETYLYPEDKDIINGYFSNYKIEKDNLWIVKQKRGDEEESAHIFNSLKTESEDFLISKYISNPHLFKGKKYYLKEYVLVTGLKPLRIYLYKEGSCIVATKNYILDSKYLNNKFVHLINARDNIRNRKEDFSQNFENSNGNKISYNEYKKYVEEENKNFNLIHQQIKDIVIKTVIMGYEYLLSKLEEYNLSDRSFLNLFEYNILIDEDYKAYLLDVNNRPDMNNYDKFDEMLEESIFADSLNIAGLIPFSHDKNQEPLDDEYKNDDPVEEAVDNAFCEITRPAGKFELIFPIKSNINNYKKFIRKNLLENEQFWKKIQNRTLF